MRNTDLSWPSEVYAVQRAKVSACMRVGVCGSASVRDWTYMRSYFFLNLFAYDLFFDSCPFVSTQVPEHELERRRHHAAGLSRTGVAVDGTKTFV
jgi:hypothetical protein